MIPHGSELMQSAPVNPVPEKSNIRNKAEKIPEKMFQIRFA